MDENVKVSMKLYIWIDCPTDYRNGAIMAVASSVEEAKQLIVAEIKAAQGNDTYEVSYKGEVEAAFTQEPRIIDLPVAYVDYGGS